MKSLYLLDTNILSEVLKPNPSKHVIEKISSRGGEIATASIVVHEISFGCLRLPENSKRRIDIQLYIDNVILTDLPIFDYNTPAALWHSEQRAKLMAQGKTATFTDGQIASIAYVNGLVLVTRNIKDFMHFNGLMIENWFEDS
jgi:tRNA(fMet)-specific endonuclease VapC